MIAREDSASIAVLRMAHGKVSALDAEFCEALVQEIGSIAAGEHKALVITGTGSSFSAGVDLFRVLSGGAAYVARFLPALESFLETLLTFPKPAIAAVNGHAIAGGCITAACCDHRIMANGNGRIGVPELAVGVPFPPLPFEIIGARVLPTAFRELVFSGRTISPSEARALGLVDEVVEPDALLSRALEVAEQLARITPRSFALTKRTIAGPILDRVQAAAAINRDVVDAWSSEDVHERIRAHLQKTLGKSK